MRQRLNKARAFKQQECLAVLEIAKVCGLWFYAKTSIRQTQTKMLILVGFTVQHFNDNLKQSNKGEQP